jgi:hypothetical protein
MMTEYRTAAILFPAEDDHAYDVLLYEAFTCMWKSTSSQGATFNETAKAEVVRFRTKGSGPKVIWYPTGTGGKRPFLAWILTWMRSTVIQ